MIIAKSNDIRDNTVSLVTGTVTGDLQFVLDPNFSKRVKLDSGTILELDLGSVTDAKYVAIHGIKWDSSTAPQLTVKVKINSVEQDSYTLDFWQRSTVFYFSSGLTGSLSIEISGADDTSIDYTAAGDVSIVPNGGVTGGQIYPYLQNNFESTNTLNETASPTGQIIRSVAPVVTLSFPNILFEWIEAELPYIYRLSNQLGAVSMLDFEGDNYDPGRSWAGFSLQPTNVSADSRYNQLNSLSMKFRAAQ